MFKKFKQWLTENYLPAYAKQVQADEKSHYEKKLKELSLENEKLKAYIAGMENGMKAIRKIQIYNTKGGN